MNKKINYTIIILSLIFIGIVGSTLLINGVSASSLFGHMPKSINKNSGKDIDISLDDVIVSHSFSNYAWSKVDYGEIVLNNGKRYLYTCSFTNQKECVYKPNGTIKENDMKKIKKYGKTLNGNKVVSKNTANDAGENSLKYYKDGKWIYLKGRGDNKIDNNSTEAKNIMKILKKYKIYI